MKFEWVQLSDETESLLIRSLALSGTRLGELAMAEPRHVDIAAATLRIAPTRMRPLKTASSNRVLPIHSSIDPVVLKGALPFTKTKRGLANLSQTLNRHLNKVVDSPNVCVHSLRHWTATKLKEVGCEDSTVADVLGHQLGTMTSRYAATSSVERLRDAIEKLPGIDASLGAKSSVRGSIKLERLHLN